MNERSEHRGADTPVCTSENTGELHSGRQECLPPDTVPFRGFDFDRKVTRTERDLPHWEQPGACYFVTFRLADSIPTGVARQWKQEREEWEKHNPKPWNEKQRSDFGKRFLRRQEQLLDQGEGECFLRRANLRAAVRDSIVKFNGIRYDLDLFVIMPNHVHLVLQVREGFSFVKEMQGLKGGSSRRCNQLLKRTGKFWQQESWDRIVRDSDELDAYRRYIENNPTKASLSEQEFRLEIYHALKI